MWLFASFIDAKELEKVRLIKSKIPTTSQRLSDLKKNVMKMSLEKFKSELSLIWFDVIDSLAIVKKLGINDIPEVTET